MFIRQRELLNILALSQEDHVTAASLALRLGVSVRTIKTYISEINTNYPSLIASSKKGYSVNRVQVKDILVHSERDTRRTKKERVHYILKKILTLNDAAIGLLELAENELYVSLETIKKDIYDVRRLLGNFNMTLEMNGGLSIALLGSEINKRKMLSNILYEEFSASVLSIEAIEKVFPQYDIAYLHEIILEACKKNCFFINEYSLLMLIIDIVISIDRIKNNFTIKYDKKNYHFKKPESSLAKYIVTKIEHYYNISYNEMELSELTVILMSNLMYPKETDLKKEVAEYIGPECAKVMTALKSAMEQYDFLDVENEKFMLRFTIHINNLILRLYNNYTRQNPLTQHLKTSCPMLFDCAIALSDVIKHVTGFKVDEAETAYIALHIGSLLQTHISMRNKVSCTVLFPAYYDYREKFIDRITKSAGDDLIVQSIIASIEEISNVETDLLISTIKIPLSCAIDSVIITPFIHDRDIEAIREKIERIKHNKKTAQLRTQLDQISCQALFLKNKAFSNEEEAIRFMCSAMIKEGYANENFTTEVLAREKNYSTAFGNIAVPHSMTMNAKKTGMFVLINEKAIPWGEGAVNITILFSINKNDTSLFYTIFDNLVVLLLEPPVANKIIACTSRDDFVKAIIECF